MTSVVSMRHVMQASVLFSLALASALLAGCGDRNSGQSSPATTVPAGTPVTLEVESPAEEGLPEPEQTPGETQATPSETEETPAEGEQSPGEPQETPGKLETPPAETEEPPVEAEKAAGETQAAPSETEEAPAKPEDTTGEASPAEEAPGASAAADEKFDPSGLPTVTWLPKPTEVPDSRAKQEADMKPYTEQIPSTDATFEMVPIPGGKFMMGSPDDEKDRKDDEGPQHEVAIDPFWMGKCEVTWDEYELWGLGLDEQRRQVMGIDPSEIDKLADAIAQPTKPYSDMSFSMGKSGYPAICMTQLAARMYCKWLSAKTGRFYRLPTEAEWEYACRAGTTTAYSFAEGEKLDDYAWHFDNADDKYHKVGQKKPNPWGLYDMHGNVAEWVLDQYVPDYYQQFAGKTTTRPLAVPTKLFPRVARGGCWDDDADRLRSAARLGSSIDWKREDPQIPQSIWYHTEVTCPGFRVVRPLRLPDVEEARLYEPDYAAVKEYREAQGGKE